MRNKILLFIQVAILGWFPCTSQTIKNEIVIINSGVSNRWGIANELAVINAYNPAVIAIDFKFAEKKDFYRDSILIHALNSCKHLIMASELAEYNHSEVVNYTELSGTLPDFLTNAKIGFTNTVLEDDKFRTLKRFSLYETVNGLTMFHFAVRTAMEFDSLKTLGFIKAHPKIIDVKYRGNEKYFKVFSHDDVLGGKVKPKDIQGKIVLLGYVGPYEGYKGPRADEDKFFSPLNKRTPPYKPDMYGVVYLANAIAQILE